MLTGIQLSSGVVVGSNNPMDSKYGPFADTASAISNIGPTLRHKGLTVGIINGTSVVEYWWKNGTADTDLIEKASLQAVSSVNSKTGNVVLNYSDVDAAQSSHTHSEYISKSGGTMTGGLSITGDLTINGDIYHQGEGYETHAEDIYTSNDFITLRDGAETGLAPGEYTGIKAKLYDGVNDGMLMFDSHGWARVGDVGDTQKIATIADTIQDNHILSYDNVSNKIVDYDPALLPISTAVTNALVGKANVDQVMYIGTKALNINRASGTVLLTGVDIDGYSFNSLNADHATNASHADTAGSATTASSADYAGYAGMAGRASQAYDSDTLGGNDPSYYQPASTAITLSNISSQTVSKASTSDDSAKLGGQLPSYYQLASTAITASNIGSQSVSHASTASSASNADTLDGYHESAFVKKSGDSINSYLNVFGDLSIDGEFNMTIGGEKDRWIDHKGPLHIRSTDENTYYDNEVTFYGDRVDFSRKINALAGFESFGEHKISGYLTGSSLNTVAQNFILDTHPETSSVTIPFINNDLAYLGARGGSVEDSLGRGSESINLVDGSPSYKLSMSPSVLNANGYVLTYTFHKNFHWGSKIGVSFGNSGWSCRYIKMEMYNSTSAQWETWGEVSNNGSGIVQFSGGSSGAYTKLRITFNDAQSNDFRLSQIWLINFSSAGPKEVFVGRDGGPIYGDLQLNGPVRLNYTDTDNEQWPLFLFGPQSSTWDEGIIKPSSQRGFYGKSHMGIHFHGDRAFGFFSTGWNQIFGMNSGAVACGGDVAI